MSSSKDLEDIRRGLSKSSPNNNNIIFNSKNGINSKRKLID